MHYPDRIGTWRRDLSAFKPKKAAKLPPAAWFGRMLPSRQADAHKAHYFLLRSQLTIRLAMVPAMIGAAKSCQKATPNCASVIWPPVLQWQLFTAILELFRFKSAPVLLPGLYRTTCGGFLFPATDAAGDQAPATLRLTGNSRLAADSTAAHLPYHCAILRSA